MKHVPRIMMCLAGLALLTLFIFPMWRITLIAAQYPEGVTMYIYINRLGGETPSTLQNINILNHYVGMKYIEPETIPELRYFPYIVGFMSACAILFGLINKRKWFLIWGLVMTALAIAGIYDFYLWEYDYGHNLSETAPIKIPGASFQPPLLGTKNILNFVAKSYPHTSGYLAGLAIVLSFAAWKLKSVLDRRSAKATIPQPSLNHETVNP